LGDFILLGQEIFVLEAELPVSHALGVPFRERYHPLVRPGTVDEELADGTDGHGCGGKGRGDGRCWCLEDAATSFSMFNHAEV